MTLLFSWVQGRILRVSTADAVTNPFAGLWAPRRVEQMTLLFLSLLLLSLTPLSSSSSAAPRRLLQSTNDTSAVACPLNFTALQQLLGSSGSTTPTTNLDTTTRCHYIKQGLRLVESLYLQTSGNFLPPRAAASSCWASYQALVDSFVSGFDVRAACGFQTDWISQGCMNVTTRAQFEGLVVPSAALDDVASACNQSLSNAAPCASCTTSLSTLQAAYLTGGSAGNNLTDCTGYPSIYAAAFANRFGPLDHGTAQCLFSFSFSDSPGSNHNHRNTVIWVVVSLFVVFLFLGFGGFCFFWRRLGKKNRKIVSGRETSLALQMESIGSTTVVRYQFDEIREATKNFNRENIIGRGGYGNVYKGVLKDGSEVAMKRFKNCSESGDPTFAHEVEVIASVRHVNLVALRGYCIATTPLEGHQRIIVCDLMRNGSLHDHLFSMWRGKLSWPVRQKIALGTARGLAYLHYGAQPGIFHRDIKASNILLDENFEPKVGDFGLAKFNPEGMTHLSTRVAGTMGYVAPEYALYGQVTERSDVYSFGVVFLELLSGKKAIMAVKDGQPSLVTEWAWDLVRKERTLDVIEDGMPDLGPPEVLEKYVLVAVLCSHPQLYARPTMDQVVKMLDMDLPVPSIPERPMPLNSTIDDIEKSVSSSGSGNLSTAAGYQPYTSEDGRPLRPNKEGETSHNPLMHNKEEGQNSGTS